MPIEITWATIAKVMLAGFATYVLLPAALVLRDAVLWKLINSYVLTKKLRSSISEIANCEAIYNSKFSVPSGGGMKEGRYYYTVDGQEVDQKEYFEFCRKQQDLSRKIDDLFIYINRKSNFLTWLLKHYKQEEDNPIPSWLKSEKERIKKLREPANKNIKDRPTG